MVAANTAEKVTFSTYATAQCTFNHRCDGDPDLQHRLRGAAADTNRTARSSQIPIARASLSRTTSRGFLPWRLSDDGPGARGSVSHGAVIRNPSH